MPPEPLPPDFLPPDPLPIDAVLPDILAALDRVPRLVLVAPPGSGKTTRLPLALLDAPWAAAGRLVLLEPRRLAARAAAERLAAAFGEAPGGRVGYRLRGESRVGPAGRIEVLTEGILTRMLQDDPDLPGIAAVLFDEIHERSIHADLGLALALEVQASLRPDLRLVAMSATLEAGRLASLMDAPVIRAEGRQFPITTHHLAQPWTTPARPRDFGPAVAELTLRALAEAPGDALVFLPGVAEIARVARLLDAAAPGLAILALHGGLDLADQRAALAPDSAGRRRVVLATAIAETSLTLSGLGIVVDGGRARRSEHDPASGLARLVTRPVSKAEADQRRGRAGREGPGVCYRLWTRGEEGALPAQPPPEILTTDLVPLALDLSLWGASDLAFLDPPPAGALAEARALLQDLGALDARGAVTAAGRALARAGTHPRLARMIRDGAAEGLGAEAALIAALVAARDPFRGRGGADLGPLLAALAAPGVPAEAAGRSAEVALIRAEARRLSPGRADPGRLKARAGVLLMRAYPDRIAQRRPGPAPRYLLANGRGAALDPADPLAQAAYLVAVDLADTRPEALIRRAVPLAEADLRAAHPDLAWVETAEWSRRTSRVEARRRQMLGALVLADQPWAAPPAAVAAALARGVAQAGIPWSPAALALRARAAWARAADPDLPDWSDASLAADPSWLEPHLHGATRLDEVAGRDLGAILLATLPAPQRARLDALAPAWFVPPLGGRVAIDYARPRPTVTIRVQELFGLTRHPMVGATPLTLELTSPAGRPIATTADLPGFWRGAWAEVRRDMRARYPRHPWPEDPAAAPPTTRAKPRGT